MNKKSNLLLRLNVFVFVTATLCSCSSLTKVEVQSTSKRPPKDQSGPSELPDKPADGWTPFQVSFHNSKAFHIVNRQKSIHGLRLNLWGGFVQNLNGLDIGCVGAVNQSLSGLQCNLVVSAARESAEGIQISGLGSHSTDFKGLQISAMNGAGRMIGAQIGALASTSAQVHGMQVASLYCGGFKKPPKVFGMQISLFNSAENLHGMQIGLINYNKNGWLPFFPLLNFGWGGVNEEEAETD